MSRWEALTIMASGIVVVIAFFDSVVQRRRQRERDARDAEYRSIVHAAIREAVGDLRDELRTEIASCSHAVGAVEDRIIRLEVDQFGSNHGGIREQVNLIGTKVDRIAECVAELRGQINGQ